MILNTILFIFFFEMINSYNCTPLFSYDVQHIDEIMNDTRVVDTVFIDTVISWRINQKINNVVALYVFNTGHEVGSKIRIQAELIDNQINGICNFYLPTNNILIAKATYKKGKLHGNVLIFDAGNIVSHHIYKNNRHIGKCDQNRVLLKIKQHHYYYPKKKCLCKDFISYNGSKISDSKLIPNQPPSRNYRDSKISTSNIRTIFVSSLL